VTRHKPTTQLDDDGYWHTRCTCGHDRIWFRQPAAQKDADRHQETT
jgi:hypothetical protein